ncbi:hypothetical protein [Streptomyces sp. NPDC056132]|uniref:hypothetical protein n=1 Tax=Streptomyces sp. NPDC056132 TaxID=3345722 RepID=UPI0035E06AC1
MSTTRRPLGTGPSSTSRTTTPTPAARLLAAERAGRGGLLADATVDQDVAAPRGRRVLGPGVSTGPEESVGR